MSKKQKTIKTYHYKKVRLDPLYKSYWYSKFINKFMISGKKHVVEHIVFKSFIKIKKKFRRTPIQLLFGILLRIKPTYGFVSRRFGKNWKKLPIPLDGRRQYILALKWFISHIKTGNEISLESNIVKAFTNFFSKKITDLTNYRKKHLSEIYDLRINHKYRWK